MFALNNEMAVNNYQNFALEHSVINRDDMLKRPFMQYHEW